MEDLWAFNDERVARAIFASEIPVISAVGHEPDVTISDFVADVRAATPSNAAELVAPDQAELRQTLANMHARMLAAVKKQLQFDRQRLGALAGRRVLQSPLGLFTGPADAARPREPDARDADAAGSRAEEAAVRTSGGGARRDESAEGARARIQPRARRRTEASSSARSSSAWAKRVEITLRKGSVSAEVREIMGGQRWQKDRRRLRRRWQRLEADRAAAGTGQRAAGRVAEALSGGDEARAAAARSCWTRRKLEVVKLMKGPDGEPVEHGVRAR